MKKYLLIALFIPTIAIAQPENRVFTIFSQAFTPLNGGTNIAPVDWDDFNATVPLGFTFSLLGRSTNTYTSTKILISEQTINCLFQTPSMGEECL